MQGTAYLSQILAPLAGSGEHGDRGAVAAHTLNQIPKGQGVRPEGQREHRECKPAVHDEGQIHATRPMLEDICSRHHTAQGASLFG